MESSRAMNLFDSVFTKKKSVLLRGPVLTQSGYGVHIRQVAKWLLSKNDIDLSIQALPWGDTPWLLDKDAEEGLIGEIMNRTVDVSGKRYDVTFQLQLPNEWDPSLGEYNVGMTAGVETDKCNPAWIDSCNTMSIIVVPSSHAKNCLTATSDKLKTPVRVIPEAYSKAITFSTRTSIDELKFSTDFNFLLFGQITGNNPENDRKNIFYTIKWFCEAFKDDKDVGLVIKTNAGRNTNIDRKIVTQMFEGLLREVRRSQFPRIHLLHGDMSDEEVASLYRHNQIKALLSLTRGEGYGLPILEAAASGLPIIATGWSGHTDFLRHGKYIEILYKLDVIHNSRVDDKIFMKGSRWAQPSEEDFKKKVLKFKNASSAPKEWASHLKEVILREYSLDNIAKSYEEIVASTC